MAKRVYMVGLDRVRRDAETPDGLVLQFIGDEIEAVFGAPVTRTDHAALAVRAALEMRERLARWNAERQRVGKVRLRLRARR